MLHSILVPVSANHPAGLIILVHPRCSGLEVQYNTKNDRHRGRSDLDRRNGVRLVKNILHRMIGISTVRSEFKSRHMYGEGYVRFASSIVCTL